MPFNKSITGGPLGIVLALLTVPAAGQLPAPNEGGVTTGHIHFTLPEPDRHQRIWESLGARPGSSGALNYLAFPGIYILLSEGEAQASSIETSANHIGFSVQDYALYKTKLQEAGASFFYENDEDGQILADLPDGVRIEILTDPQQSEPIIFHHMHLATEDPEALRDWYQAVFAAEPGERRGLPSALVPGGRIDIMGALGAAPKASRGGALDHIGFEVADMDAFAARLADLGIAFDRAPRHIEAIGLTIAFLTDPAGTYIEVTQGLAAID